MYIPGFDFEQFKLGQQRKDPVLKADLTDKVVIVTGANTGLGYEEAKHFASMGPKKLILACRSQTRGEAALERLRTETGFTAAELWLLDQSDFESVKAFASRVDTELERLDILVENAGVALHQYVAGKHGFEEGTQVNNLSPELLTLLLLPKLIKTHEEHKAIPRIVIIASNVHTLASIPEDIVKSENIHQAISTKEFYDSYPPTQKTYFLAKLLNVFFVRALHSHLKTESIIVTAVEPGYCSTELVRHVPEEQKDLLAAFGPYKFTSEEGSRHVVWAALAHEGEQTLNGAYAWVSEVVPFGPFVTTELGVEAEKKLWRETIEILVGVDERVPSIVAKYLKN